MDVRRKSVLKGLFNIPLCMLIIFLALTFFLEPIRINFEFKINLQKRRNSLNFNYHTKVKEVRHDRKRSD